MHLAAYMVAKELRDEDFAPLIARSRATVSRIRRGKVRPDWETIERIKAVTDGDVTADDFMAAPSQPANDPRRGHPPED